MRLSSAARCICSEREACCMKCRCYLAISHNDQFGITPETTVINQREFAFEMLSYLRS